MYSNGLNEKESRIRRGGHARTGVWVIRDSGENKQRLGERKEVVHVERRQPCLCRSLERSAQACGQGQHASQHVPMGESREGSDIKGVEATGCLLRQFAHAFREKGQSRACML